jgi:hypothetical protein
MSLTIPAPYAVRYVSVTYYLTYYCADLAQRNPTLEEPVLGSLFPRLPTR